MTHDPSTDANHFVFNAGRQGPFVVIDPKHAGYYGALLVVAGLSAWPIATRWQPLGFVGTLALLTLAFGAVVAVYYRGKAYAEWWAGEVHFESTPDALVGWHGTATRRAKVATFAAGEVLAVASDTRTAVPRLVVSAAGEALILGPQWGIYPREFEKWRLWAEARGWTVNDTYIDDPGSKRARALLVADDWVEFPVEADASQFVWGVPCGPDPAGARAGGDTDWLPVEDPRGMNAFTSTLAGSLVTSVAARLGDISPDAQLTEFSASASGASIRQGEVIADLEFADAVDAVAVSHTPDGRVEFRFRRVTE